MNSLDDTHPHVSSEICGKCRKAFQRGDRIVTAFIFDRRGLNPLNLGNSGVLLHEEFELVHVDCRDPSLTKGLLDG